MARHVVEGRLAGHRCARPALPIVLRPTIWVPPGRRDLLVRHGVPDLRHHQLHIDHIQPAAELETGLAKAARFDKAVLGM